MATQAPLRILCLDGGGVRGLSSLYILKELMSQIRRNKEAGSRLTPRGHLRPCDYFDLICGTGTGGILAIMLGRLQYDIETAIKAYVSLATAVFETGSSEDRALFDTGTLDAEILKIIKASPDGSKEDAVFEDPRVRAGRKNCRTLVLASRPEGLGKAAVRMRSYATEDDDPFQAQIWQVARATSASPTYFLPIDINGIRYGDGRVGWSNPTMEAINEAYYIWPGRPVACVVSVGTGLEDAVQLETESKAPSVSGVLGFLFQSLTPRQAFELAVAQYCVSCVTSCERIHGQVASNLAKFGIDGPLQYVRLNVPQGMAKIGLQEWKRFQMIAAMTEDYMQDIYVRELKRQVAERLSSPECLFIPASVSASIPVRVPMGRIEYSSAKRNIEARGGPATQAYSATTSSIPESSRSNALVRQQILPSRQQQGPLKGDRSESSSDESGAQGQGQMKRSKVETESGPSLLFSTANRGRLRHPPQIKSSSLPVNDYPLQNRSVFGQPMTTSYGDVEDEGQTFVERFDVNELSATVLCCDYLECQSMGALQKDYLKDHYRSYHEEYLIKPPMMIPSGDPMVQSRSFRCSHCLRKLTDECRGCNDCQRFGPTRRAVMNASLTDMNSGRGKALISSMSIPTQRQAGSTDSSIWPPERYEEDIDTSTDTSSTGNFSGSSLKEDTEGNTAPKPSFWTPPEVPEHWTSYTPSTPRRVNANIGHSRTRPLLSFNSPHTMPASVRKAREEYRRQRFYHENG